MAIQFLWTRWRVWWGYEGHLHTAFTFFNTRGDFRPFLGTLKMISNTAIKLYYLKLDLACVVAGDGDKLSKNHRFKWLWTDSTASINYNYMMLSWGTVGGDSTCSSFNISTHVPCLSHYDGWDKLQHPPIHLHKLKLKNLNYSTICSLSWDVVYMSGNNMTWTAKFRWESRSKLYYV